MESKSKRVTAAKHLASMIGVIKRDSSWKSMEIKQALCYMGLTIRKKSLTSMWNILVLTDLFRKIKETLSLPTERFHVSKTLNLS